MLGVVYRLPLHYPYYYLRNARDNHAPLPFWGYSQLYSEAWNYQANIDELNMQLGQLLISGTKGIMFFQSDAAQLGKHDTSVLKRTLSSIVSEIVLAGDIMGVPLSSDALSKKKILAETIVTPEKLLLVVVNTVASSYNNLICHTGLVGRHWSFSKHKVDSLTLDVTAAPGIAKFTNWQEATKDGLVPLSDVDVQGEAGHVKLSQIALDKTENVRLFVADVVSADDAMELTV